eukprot:5205084-Pyramimonas_sp.AAC.1
MAAVVATESSCMPRSFSADTEANSRYPGAANQPTHQQRAQCLMAVVWTLRAAVWTLRAAAWTLKAAMWTLKAA